jgi:hypothetical protein
MYPKQLYQAQGLFNSNKDNFRDIKIEIHDDLPLELETNELDHCLMCL